MLQMLLLHLLESLSINRYELSLFPVLNKLILFLLCYRIFLGCDTSLVIIWLSFFLVTPELRVQLKGNDCVKPPLLNLPVISFAKQALYWVSRISLWPLLSICFKGR